MPKRYRDDLPINPNPPIISVPVTEPEEDNNVLDDNASERPDSEHLSTSEYDSTYCTEENSFGIYRKYSLGPPTITPDDSFTLSSISDSVSIARDPADSRSKASWWSSFGSSCLTTLENATDNYFTPFLNASVFLLMAWYYNGSSIKSYADIDKLIHDVVRHEDFRASDFGETFSTAREAERMDKHQASKSSASSDNCEDLPFKPGDGWISGCVSIPLPCDGFRFNSEEDAPRFVVNQIWYRRPLEVIKKAFTEPAAEKFHISPFNEYWKPSQDGPEERLYSETYTADLFNDEYETLLATPREGPNSKLEPFVAGIVFYSDSTHLTSFGTASLWPIYMYIGNQSQYIRGKPSEFAAHHIAYIPKVCKCFFYPPLLYLMTTSKARRRDS
jgi:Plavaka transposase